MKYFKKIVSGGQSGADRAALDFAINNKVNYGGWCPHGGLAEDFHTPPGLLLKYPKLKETPTRQTAQRTIWNVRDSDATIIFVDHHGIEHSRGTKLTIKTARNLQKPYYIIDLSEEYEFDKIDIWLKSVGNQNIINIAGPRASESKGIYSKVYSFLDNIKNIHFKKI